MVAENSTLYLEMTEKKNYKNTTLNKNFERNEDKIKAFSDKKQPTKHTN